MRRVLSRGARTAFVLFVCVLLCCVPPAWLTVAHSCARCYAGDARDRKRHAKHGGGTHSASGLVDRQSTFSGAVWNRIRAHAVSGKPVGKRRHMTCGLMQRTRALLAWSPQVLLMVRRRLCLGIRCRHKLISPIRILRHFSICVNVTLLMY
jgi:hypothetical protein